MKAKTNPAPTATLLPVTIIEIEPGADYPAGAPLSASWQAFFEKTQALHEQYLDDGREAVKEQREAA